VYFRDVRGQRAGIKVRMILDKIRNTG
jgi:hypothetical protein